MIEQYQKNRVIFLAIIIILVITTSVIYYYSSKKSDLENCAEEKLQSYKRFLETVTEYTKDYSTLIAWERLLEKPVKEKMKDKRYKIQIEVCENDKLKSPESFKLQYGN
jgi:hypothetical protein